MRRSVQPNCPRAMTCCFFVSLKMLAMPAEGPRSLPPRQRLERLLPMAVFQVSMYGRFWVSTEAEKADASGRVLFRADADLCYYRLLPHTCLSISLSGGRAATMSLW